MLARRLERDLPTLRRLFHATVSVGSSQEEGDTYRLPHATSTTAGIIKSLSDAQEPLTTTELWDKCRKRGDFDSKRQMKLALRQLKHYNYIKSCPNNGTKTGDLSQNYVFELTPRGKKSIARREQRQPPGAEVEP
eukprot:evm.model.scf_152.3 EVM.evm.TU.scf_152.3   scf_152:56704-62087(-)